MSEHPLRSASPANDHRAVGSFTTNKQLANDILKKDGRFRILIIGNANAGKTTILEKVCNAQGLKPEAFDKLGHKIDPDLNPSTRRGEHDIENQITYPTDLGFVFHDSRGFEAGGADELKKVRDFITERATRPTFKDQLHAIWYCFSTGEDRPSTLVPSAMEFFESRTGNVPVIAIITKTDHLEKKIGMELVKQLIHNGLSRPEARIRAKDQTLSRLDARLEEDYNSRLRNVPHPPAGIVHLHDMHKGNTNCNALINATAESLDERALRLLCLSVLRNNWELCVDNAIKQTIIPHVEQALEKGTFSQEQQKSLLGDLSAWFPHILPALDRDTLKMAMDSARAAETMTGSEELSRLRRMSMLLSMTVVNAHLVDCFDALSLLLPSLIDPSPLRSQVTRLGIAIIGIAECALFVSSATSSDIDSFRTALNLYCQSPVSAKLMAEVNEALMGSDESLNEADAAKLIAIVMTNHFSA